VLAILLFFTWQRSQRETRSRADAAPKSGRFIKISDGEIYIQETGTVSDRPVLFIHGVGAWSELWRETLDQCPFHGSYCIALDLPPFGFSEVVTESRYTRVDQSKRILELMQQVNPAAQFTLVGHSFGAGPTVEAVMRDPSHVSALVIVDGALGIDVPAGNPGPVAALFSSRTVRNAVISAAVTNPMFTKQLLTPLMYNQQSATEARVRLLQQPLALENATDHVGDWALDFMSSASEQSQSRWSGTYSRLIVPVQIIWGEYDTITPLAQGEQIHQLLPRSDLIRLANVGHMPQIEDVDAFNAALFAFLDSQR
jgi:pimeloyl-ACP methyl ester carboxylesterase